MMNIIPKY